MRLATRRSTLGVRLATVLAGRELEPIYAVWSLELLTSGVTNLLVALAILRRQALRTRKEYLIILGLCFADFTYIGSFFMAGG